MSDSSLALGHSLDEIAYHEAAHTVIRRLFGITSDLVEVQEHSNQDTVSYDGCDRCWNGLSDPQNFECNAMVAVAGVLSQAMFFARDQNGWEDSILSPNNLIDLRAF